MKWLTKFFKRGPSPADNYSQRAQKLLVHARKQADRLHQSYVGTEHLLLGLIELREGVGFTALQKLGVNPANLATELEVRSGMGKETTVAASIPMTPMMAKALRHACDEASKMGHTYVGTEHIFLGLTRLRWGIGPAALKKQGVDLQNARSTVAEILQEPPGGKSQSHPIPQSPSANTPDAPPATQEPPKT